MKRGDFDSYSNEGMITNLTDSKVQLLTTTKELDGGVLRDPLLFFHLVIEIMKNSIALATSMSITG